MFQTWVRGLKCITYCTFETDLAQSRQEKDFEGFLVGMRRDGIETAQLPAVSTTGVLREPYGESFRCFTELFEFCFIPKAHRSSCMYVLCFERMHTCKENLIRALFTQWMF